MWAYTNSFYNCLMLILTVPKLHKPFGSCNKAVFLSSAFFSSEVFGGEREGERERERERERELDCANI